MIISTSTKGQHRLKAKAEAVAKDFNCQFIKRYKLSVEELFARGRSDEAILVTSTGLKYLHKDNLNQPFFFHPSSAAFRIKRLIRGEVDPLIEASNIQPGDYFLDCTMGFGADALVAAHCVAEQGRVIGLEASKVIAYIVRDGLKTWLSDQDELMEAMRRITVVHTHHLSYLQQQETGSVDIIYFDPMFQHAVESSTHMQSLRQMAAADAIQLEAINEAKRVARKRIVYKDSAYSENFYRLGFEPIKRKNASHWYGVIQVVL